MSKRKQSLSKMMRALRSKAELSATRETIIGCRADLALRNAYRDLRTAGQPLASIKAIVDRSQYRVRPGSVLKVTWPEYGLVELIMRVVAVDYGKPEIPRLSWILSKMFSALISAALTFPPARHG